MALLSRDLFSGTVVSVVDQAMLSALNLAIGLAIIRLGEKLDYGIYVQLFTLLLLAQGLQDALINAPMVALAPKRQARRMQAMCAHLFRLQFCIALLMAGLALIGVLVAERWVADEALPGTVALPFAAAVIGQASREYARDFSFLELKPSRVLALDTLYVVIVISGLLLGAVLGRLDVEWVFSCVAVGGMAAGAVGIQRSRLRPLAVHGRGWPVLREAWHLSRWALPSVVLWWASNYAFVYVVAAMLGVLATADVGAARLLLMPVGLCSVAWGNVFLPRASRWVGQRAFKMVERVAILATGGLSLLIVVYMGVLLVVYAWLETWVLSEEYAGLESLAVAWGAFFIAAAFRNAGTQALSAGARYQSLFWYTLIGLCVTFPIVILLTWRVGVTGAVWAQAIGEVLMGAVVWLHGWPRLKRQWTVASDDSARAS